MKKGTFWFLILVLIVTGINMHAQQQNTQGIKRLASVDDFRSYVKSVKKNTTVQYFGPFGVRDMETGALKNDSIDYTPTNNQVTGVDEADIIKTNGEYIYVLYNNELTIYRSYPLDDASKIQTIKLSKEDEPRYYNQMLLYNNKLVLFGESGYFWRWYDYSEPTRDVDDGDKGDESGQSNAVDPFDPDADIDDKIAPDIMMPYNITQKIDIYDVSDPSTLKLLKSIEIEGSLAAARLVDGTLYLVTNKYNDMLVYSNEDLDVDDVLPIRKIDGEPVDNRVDEITVSEPDSLNMMTITKFNLDTNKHQFENFMGNVTHVYMTPDRLFAASTNYQIFSNPKTTIYQFTINNQLELLSQGEVEGYLLNSFAMDYYNDHLRVASTTFKNQVSVNSITVFNRSMNKIATLGNLAKDESIYSVLFKQDTAYVVTFKQIDPFFVIDLSTPSNPKVLGELKIPGFSSYLHKVDQDHVLGFGKDVDPTNEMLIAGAFKLSLFDVSDKSDPIEIDTLMIGSGGTYGDILYDHKALMVDPQRKLFGFVLSNYDFFVREGDTAVSDEGYFQELIVVKIIDQTIEVQFRHKSSKDDALIRSLIIEDSLYLLSSNSMSIYSLSDYALIKQVSR